METALEPVAVAVAVAVAVVVGVAAHAAPPVAHRPPRPAKQERAIPQIAPVHRDIVSVPTSIALNAASSGTCTSANRSPARPMWWPMSSPGDLLATSTTLPLPKRQNPHRRRHSTCRSIPRTRNSAATGCDCLRAISARSSASAGSARGRPDRRVSFPVRPDPVMDRGQVGAAGWLPIRVCLD